MRVRQGKAYGSQQSEIFIVQPNAHASLLCQVESGASPPGSNQFTLLFSWPLYWDLYKFHHVGASVWRWWCLSNASNNLLQSKFRHFPQIFVILIKEWISIFFKTRWLGEIMVLGLGTAHLQHANNTCVQICHIKTIHNSGNVNVPWCAPVWEPTI